MAQPGGNVVLTVTFNTQRAAAQLQRDVTRASQQAAGTFRTAFGRASQNLPPVPVRVSTEQARKQLQQQLGQSAGKESASGFKDGFSGALKELMPAVGVAAALGGFKAIIGASEALDAAVGSTGQIFKESGDQVTTWAKNTANGIGLSTAAALQATTGFGAFFTSVGFGTQEAAKLSESWTQVAANLAAFKNVDTQRALDAIQGSLRGEYDALQFFIPTVSAAAIEQEAMAESGKTNAKALTQQEKALAINSLLLQDNANAAGQAELQNGNLTLSLGKMKAEITDSAAALGKYFTPALESTANLINDIGPMTVAFGAGALLLGNRVGKASGSLTSFSSSVRLASTNTQLANEAAARYNTVLSRVQAQTGPATAAQRALATQYMLAGNAALTAAGQQTGFAGGLGRVIGNVRSATTTMGTLRAVMGGVGSAATGIGSALLGAFGGPVGIAVSAAAIGIGIFAQKSAEAKANAEALQGSLKSYADIFKDGITPATLDAANAAFKQDANLRGLVKTTQDLGITTDTLVKGLNGDAEARKVVVDTINAQIEANEQERRSALEGLVGEERKRVNKIYEDRNEILTRQRIAFAKTNTAAAQSNELTAAAAKEQANAATQTQVHTDKLGPLATALGGAAEAFQKQATEADTSSERIKLLTSMGDQYAGSAGTAGDAAALFAEQLLLEAGSAGTAEERVTALKDAQDILIGSSRSALDAQESFNSSLDKLGKGEGIATIKVKEFVKGANAHTTAMKNNFKATTETKKAIDDYGRLVTTTTRKFLENGNIVTAVTKKIDDHGKITESTTRKVEAGTKATQNNTEASKGHTVEVDKNTTSLSKNTEEGVANRDMLEDLFKKNEDQYYANIANGDSIEVATQKYKDNTVAIEDAAVKAGFNKGEVQKLNTEYGKIPEAKTTTVSVALEGFDKVYDKLIQLQTIQEGIDRNMTKQQIKQELLNREAAANNPFAYQYRKDLSYGGKAEGGLITGPGGPTSDSVPIMASNREFMQPVHAVDYYGVGTMERLRRHQIPREALNGFADGGQVTTPARMSSVGSSKSTVYQFNGPIQGLTLKQVLQEAERRVRMNNLTVGDE